MKNYYVLAMFFFSQLVFSESYNWDIININGEIVYKIENAKNVENFNEKKMLIQFENYFTILNENFEKITTQKITLKNFANLNSGRIPFYNNEKFGYLSLSGEVSIKAIYDSANNFINGYAIVGFGDTAKPPPHRLRLKIIDIEGNYCSNFESKYIYLSRLIQGKGIAIINGEYEIISNLYGEWMSDNVNNGKYKLLKSVGQYIVYAKDGYYGFMTWDGKILTPPIYSGIYNVSDSSFFSVITKNKLRKIVNVFGANIPVSKDTQRVIGDGGFFVNQIKEKEVLYDLKLGKQIIEPIFDSIIGISDNILVVKLDKKYGYAKINGDILSEIQYDKSSFFKNGFAVAGILIK